MKLIKELQTEILLFGIIIFFVLFYAGSDMLPGTNYTSQQIDNFIYGLPSIGQSIPDSSIGVRLMPDHIIHWFTDSVKSSGTKDTVRALNYYSKRWKFTISSNGGVLMLRLYGSGIDTIHVRNGASYSSDYLHPLYDSLLLIEPVSGTANYDFGSEGR